MYKVFCNKCDEETTAVYYGVAFAVEGMHSLNKQLHMCEPCFKNYCIDMHFEQEFIDICIEKVRKKRMEENYLLTKAKRKDIDHAINKERNKD